MDDKLYIPKKLNVGFQLRGDTYSGRLGYVIYWDDKGKLRKQTSWENWRHKEGDKVEVEDEHDEENGGYEIIANDSVRPLVTDNEPTEGFVVNKEVGGVSRYHDWYDHDRIEKVRVYDPRGFEFEITIPNLLFILQECACSPGKGLEGQFVYAWAGPELVLLPVKSAEYKQSMEFTGLQAKKLVKSDMIAGCAYTTKKLEKLIYLGKFDWYVYDYITRKSYDTKCQKKLNGHVFWQEYDKPDYDGRTGEFILEKGFTKLATRNTDAPVDNYAELVDQYLKSHLGSKMVGLELERKEVEFKYCDYRKMDEVQGTYFIPSGKNFYKLNIDEHCEWKDGGYEYDGYNVDTYERIIYDATENTVKSEWLNHDSRALHKKITKEKLQSLELYGLFVVLESGTKVPYNNLF